MRVGEPVTLRLAVTNAGGAPASGTYALILDEPGAIAVLSASTTAGGLAVSGPSSAVWTTGPIAPGATVTADLVVRTNVTTAVKLKVVRVEASVPDPDATNDATAVALDGVGPAPASGRWVATGNVDGIAGGEILTGTGRANGRRSAPSAAPAPTPACASMRSIRRSWAACGWRRATSTPMASTRSSSAKDRAVPR